MLLLALFATAAQADCVDDAYATLHRLEHQGIAESRLMYAIYDYGRPGDYGMVVMLDGRWIYDNGARPADVRRYPYRLKYIIAPGTPLNQLPRHLAF